jgi:hypothetical protein
MQNDNRHVIVACWYYTHFMVKQQDDPGHKGAGLIALAPVQLGHLPKCVQALQPGEKEFKGWDGEFKTFVAWNGYFAGVKDDLVFLERPDADETIGIPFTAFEPNAKTKVSRILSRSRSRREGSKLPCGIRQSDHPPLPSRSECLLLHPKVRRDLLEQAETTNGPHPLTDAEVQRLRGQVRRNGRLCHRLPCRSLALPEAFDPPLGARSSATPLSDSPIERVSLRTATCPRSRAPKEVIAHRLPSVPVWPEPSQLLIGQLPFRS